MSSQCGIKLAAGAVLLSATLAACSEYLDRRDGLSMVSGEAMAANRVTHMIDPWPPASGRRSIAYSGEKAATAAERYRTGRVIPPVNATTSSAAYAQAQQAAQSASNGHAASGNNNSNNSR
jgi:hypothetical protein